MQNLESYVSILTMISIVAGGVFALIQLDQATKIKRAEFLREFIDFIRNDDDMINIMYKIDYSELSYPQDFHQSEDEKKIDRLLSYLSYLCYLKKGKLFSDKEFEYSQYLIQRVLSCEQIITYLWNLNHFSLSRKYKSSFFALIEYGKDAKLLPIEFDNPKSKKFVKALNF